MKTEEKDTSNDCMCDIDWTTKDCVPAFVVVLAIILLLGLIILLP
jgi:hypothetical protein